MDEVEMILCDDGPTEDQEAEEITDIFKTQSENAKSPISDDLETKGEKVENLTTNVLEEKNENLKSPIRNALATQSKNVENLNNTPDTLSAQSDGGDDLPITVDILETQNESGKGCDKISDIPKTQSTPLEEGLVEKTDVSENQKTKVDNTKEITDSLKTQSECEDSSKESPNILDIQRKLEKDWMEVAEISENVEISQSNHKESSKGIDVQSDNEDEMEISVAFEVQNENVEDPIDECIEIADETQNENLEDPIKVTYILKAQKPFEQGSAELADIVEIQSDNDDGVLIISDDVEKINKNSEHPHEIIDILETQSEFREGNSKSKNLERSIERNTDNFETKSMNEDSSNESTVDLQKSTNNSVSSKDKTDVIGKKNKNDVKFKRHLIKEVRKQRSLYDTRSKGFANLDTKMKAWQNIATAMKKDVEICKQNWVDLRYNYQRYVRKLRKYLSSENINNKRRPVMAFERELLFLWRYIADRSRCPMKQTLLRKNDMTDINIETIEDDDVVLVEDEPVLIINLEDNDDSDDDLNKKEDKTKQRKNECKITIELRKLVELLKEYPELYNIYHPCYNDYGRRGLIWSSFANELKDKATKLMKLWIYVQTRYEWELNSMKTERTELQELLEFLKPYINVNPNTVYKQSFYLRSGWQEPIEAFKIIFQLLATLRKYPKLIDSTITKNTGQNFLVEYKRQWSEIGELRGFPPGQCENTWLIMRSFYWELINMRKNSYQLQDKWYFESIISELYMHTDQFKSKTPDTNNDISDEVHGKSYAFSKPIPETQLTVKSFANLNALPETPKDSNLLEKQLKRKAVGTVPIKLIPVKPKNVPSSSKQLSSNQFTNTNTTVLPRHTTPITFGAEIQPHATPMTFETELPTKSSSAMVSIDITSSPPPSPSPSVPPLTPITAQNSTSTTNTQITTASEALSSNEILIELVASSAGNMLLINEATKKYSLNMTTTAKFIREIMAIPFLHNKELPPSAKHNHWVFIANRFQLPHHIAIACWDFLLENFQHFDQIAPMDQLMAPFPNFKVWKENTKPFQNFHSYAVKKGWFTYLKNLPVLMMEMAKYPELYDDALAKRNSSIPLSILSKFPHIHATQISEICTAFKNAFVTYMKDLEQGIANKWPEQWWHVLEKLKFLVDVRYNKYEPFYYIIKNKIQEEIERNKELERLKAQQKAKVQQAANSGKANKNASATSYQKPQSTVKKSKSYQIRANADPYSLILAIRRHPNIYENCSNDEKLKAWTEVAQEMNSTVAACRQNFQRAFRDYRLYIHRDPAARCRLNHRYFKHMKDIFRSARTHSNKLSIKTPTELNQSLSESNETVFPERFIVDINMDNSKPALVMKNWSYAIGNLHVYTQDSMQSVLRSVFNKYRNQSASTSS